MRVTARPALYSVSIFATGIFAAMSAAGFSYLAQFCYSRADMIDEGNKKKAFVFNVALTLHGVAVLAAIWGIVSFAIGAHAGIEALGAANGGLSKN